MPILIWAITFTYCWPCKQSSVIYTNQRDRQSQRVSLVCLMALSAQLHLLVCAVCLQCSHSAQLIWKCLISLVRIRFVEICLFVPGSVIWRFRAPFERHYKWTKWRKKPSVGSVPSFINRSNSLRGIVWSNWICLCFPSRRSQQSLNPNVCLYESIWLCAFILYVGMHVCWADDIEIPLKNLLSWKIYLSCMFLKKKKKNKLPACDHQVGKIYIVHVVEVATILNLNQIVFCWNRFELQPRGLCVCAQVVLGFPIHLA